MEAVLPKEVLDQKKGFWSAFSVFFGFGLEAFDFSGCLVLGSAARRRERSLEILAEKFEF